MTRTAWGHGLLTLTDDGTVLDAWFPAPALGEPGGAGELAAPPGSRRSPARDEARGVRRELRLVTADLDAPPGRRRRRLAAAAPALAPARACPTRSTSTACSACSPTSCGPRRARAPSTASS